MSEDLIKRSDAIRVVDHNAPYLSTRDLVNRLYQIPSADRPQGEWETAGEKVRYKRCPFCKRAKAFEDSRFCDWCGAKMRPKLQGTHFDSIIIDECAMKGADDDSYYKHD